MTAFYNEFEPYAAQWLRNLEQSGEIAPGVVDDRDIRDITPGELAGYTQAHFFAGIGVWSYALRRAGWADGTSVWTGSCPCQPFSTAGKGAGFDDERHLWPDWFRLIRECRPRVVLGEQSPSTAGMRWLDLVSSDMEGIGYAVGAVVFPAAGVGAPHQRHRLYFVAYRNEDGREGAGVSDTDGGGGGRNGGANGRAQGSGAGARGATRGQRDGAQSSGAVDALADTVPTGWTARGTGAGGGPASGGSSLDRPVAGFWADAEWIPCHVPGEPGEVEYRPVEPGTFPMAARTPTTVGQVGAYGNALCAEQAVAFIGAVMDTLGM